MLWIFAALFLLLSAICTIGYAKKKQKERDIFVVYTALFEVTETEANAFSVGDILTDARGKEAAGEILSIDVRATLAEDAYGTYPLPARKNLVITLGGKGHRTEREAKIGTLTPRVGEALHLFGRAKLSGICLRVRTI